MNDSKPDESLDAKARHDARVEIVNQGVRGLFLINGGGAIALLAFLPDLVKKKALNVHVEPVIYGILLLLSWIDHCSYYKFFSISSVACLPIQQVI